MVKSVSGRLLASMAGPTQRAGFDCVDKVAQELLGFKAATSLADGLDRTR